MTQLSRSYVLSLVMLFLPAALSAQEGELCHKCSLDESFGGEYICAITEFGGGDYCVTDGEFCGQSDDDCEMIENEAELDQLSEQADAELVALVSGPDLLDRVGTARRTESGFRVHQFAGGQLQVTTCSGQVLAKVWIDRLAAEARLSTKVIAL